MFANFARRTNSRIYESREIFIIVMLPIIEINNSRILDFVKFPKIKNSRKSNHAKITR